MSPLQTVLKNLISAAQLSLYGGCIVITFMDNIGYAARVDGESMQPVLNPVGRRLSDFILLDKWTVQDYKFQRGEIVILKSPSKPNSEIIKRIIGLEGDKITTREQKPRTVIIPKGHCWIEGDNASSSIDSNKYGPVALGLIVARAPFIIWPPTRWKRLGSSTPVQS